MVYVGYLPKRRLDKNLERKIFGVFRQKIPLFSKKKSAKIPKKRLFKVKKVNLIMVYNVLYNRKTKSRKTEKPMKFYHATPTRNLKSILKNGLDPNKAKSKFKNTWMCVESNIEWAILHTVGKHKAAVNDITILELDVPRSWVRNHKLVIRKKSRRGFWKTDRHIHTNRIKSVKNALEFGYTE